MLKLLILTLALVAISVAAPPSNDRLPISPIHADHKHEPIVPAEDLSTLSKSSEEKRKELEKDLGIHRERRDHHEGHEKTNEKPHQDRVSGGDKKAQVLAKPLPLKHEEPNKHEHHKRDVVADKQPEKTAAVLVHEQQHKPHGIALKDPLAKPEEKKENPSSCLCKKEKRDVHELPTGAVCHCPKEKRDIPRPEDGHKHEQKPNEHPHDDQKDDKKNDKKDSSEESSEEKNKNTKLHASQRQKRDIHELTKEHDEKVKKSSEESSNESKEENKGKSTTTTLSLHNNHKRNVPKKSSEESSEESKEENKNKDGTTTPALPPLSPHDNHKRDLPVPTVPKHEHPATSETLKADANKDGKAQVEDLGSHIPPSAKPSHAHTATVAHTTHYTTTNTPGLHPLISNEPKPIKSLRPHDQV